MAESNHIKNFTAADIEKYWKGDLSTEEMHALERAAMDDPFLADALEGYKNTSSASADLKLLQQRLDDRTKTPVAVINLNRKKYAWLRIAAAIIIISGAGLLIEQLVFTNRKQATIVSLEKKENNGAGTAVTKEAGKDSIRHQPSTPDSLNSAANEKAAGRPPATLPVQGLAVEESKDNDQSAAEVTQRTEEVITQPAAGIGVNAIKKEDSREASLVNKPQTDSPKPENEIKPKAAAKQAYNDYELAGRDAAVSANKFNYRVVDAQNNPIPFANVTSIRDNIGTYTDIRGNFNLLSTDSVLDVRVRSLGYNSANYKLVPSTKQNELVLSEDDQAKKQIPAYNRTLVSNVVRRDSSELEEPEVGWGNYNTYVANNIQIPGSIRDRNSRSDVEVSFDIDRAGTPINIKVTKSSQCKACDEEAVRLLKEGPKWKRKGKRSKTTIAIAIDQN